MVSKRDLGVSYFLGTGLGLIVSLLGYLVLVDSAADVVSLGTVTALGLAGSLPYLGLWLRQSDLTDSAVWAVARWCAVGLTGPTVIAGGLIAAGIHPRIVVQFPHLLVNFVAAGGAVGAWVGLLVELRRQNSRAEALNRRNTILNHLMRHDIRNDVSVIKGYADIIGDRLAAEDRALLAPIENKSDAIIETSRIARQIQSIDDDADRKPVGLTIVVAEYVSEVRETHPDATITMDLPEQARVQAGDLVRTVVDNLVENAIEHHGDGAPTVTISVEATDDGQYTLRVADDGPGIPAATKEALRTEHDAPMGSQPGLGLWLVKWVVESYDGTLSVEDREPRGTVVRVTLPAVEPTVVPA